MKYKSKGYLKFLFVGIILFAIIFSFCALPATLCYNNNANDLTFEEFNEGLKELCSDDNYESIELDENITFSDLISALNNGAVTYASNNETPLTLEEIQDICEELGYSVHFDGEQYHFDQHFGLKRLIVTGGEVNENYGATDILTGYKGYTILEYSTVEQTEYAYYQLSNQNDITVSADTVVYASSTVEGVADRTYHSWGAGADYVNVDAYYSYLEQNQTRQVVVAVLDSGIDTDHEMFVNENRILTDSNGNMVGARFVGDGGTSFEDDATSGHGTHVSGIICDLTPNNVKILPVKVLDSAGEGTSLWMLSALEYLATLTQYDIVAVNISISGDNYSGATTDFDEVFNDIKTAHNALSVVAAGNDNRDTSNNFPACCTNSAVVVSNMADDKTLGYNSNFGSTVDITAPGMFIESAQRGGGYVEKSGTSMAAPHVSAVVALLCLDPRYDNTSYTATTIENRLYDLAVDIGATGKDTSFGYGMVCLTGALGEVSYTARDATFTYDGSYHNISVTINSGISCEIAYRTSAVSSYYTDITSSVFNNAFKNAVSNMVVYFRITPADSNYSITYGSARLTINPIDVTVIIDDKTSVYGQDLETLTWSTSSSSSFAPNENESLLGVLLSPPSSNNAGSYRITGTWSNSNYDVTFRNTQGTSTYGTYTITPKAITITVLNLEAVYGQEPNTANCSARVTGLVSGESISILNLSYQIDSSISATSHVGTYQDVISATIRNSNYSPTIIPGDYIVNERPIVIKIEKSSTYGNTPSALSSSDYTITGEYEFLSDDNVTVNITLNTSVINSNTDVGEYVYSETNFVQSYSCSNSNYSLSIDSTSYYSITQRNIHIAINDRTGYYGEPILDDNSAYEITSGSIVNNDNLNINLVVNATGNALPGAVFYITCSASNDNYYVTSTLGRFTVLQRPITITTSQTFEYGDELVLNSNNYSITEDSYSILEGDEITFTLFTDLEAPVDVGTYYNRIQVSESNELYDIVISSASTINITKKEVTVTFNDQTSEYGEDVIENLTYTLYSNGEIVSESNLYNFVTIEPNCYVNPLVIDEYVITATPVEDDNYTIEIIDGTYYVIPRKIVISIINSTSVYGEQLSFNGYSTGGEYISEDLMLTYTLINPTTNMNATTNQFGFYNVGEYYITAVSGNENYDVTPTRGVYVITQRQLTISALLEVEYGTSFNSNNLAGVEVELRNGTYAGEDTNLNLQFSTTATQNSPIAEYPIYVTCNNNNYSVSLTSDSEFRIVSQIIYLTIEDQESTYGEEIVLNDYVLIEGERVSLSTYNLELSTNADNTSTVNGNYYITLISNNPNYSFNFENATLTITPRDITIRVTQSGVYGYQHTLDNDDYTEVNGNVVNNDNLNLSLQTNAEINDPVGNNYDVILLDFNDNYNVTLTSDSAYSVTARQITITKNQTIEYGNALELDSAYTLVYGNVLSGDDLGLSFSVGEIANPSVGSRYPISLTNYTNTNYDITFRGGYLTFEARKITISTTQFGYYGDVPTFDYENYSEIEGSVVNGDDLELVFETNATNESPISDTYTLTLISHNENYNVILTDSSYVIYPRPITISSYQTGIYGDVPAFDYENYSEIEGSVVNGDDLELVFVTNATSESPIGDTYTLTLISHNENYDVVLTGSYTITQRQITITTNQSLEYGDEILLDETRYSTINGSVVNEDNLGLQFSTDAETNSPIGTYPIYLDGYSNKNYLIDFVTGELTITAKTIEIVISNATSVYGEEISSPTFALQEGYTLVNGDELTDLNITLSVNAQINSNAGSDYEVSWNNNYNGNYYIVCENTAYTIQRRQIEIIINDVTATYGDDLHELTFALAEGSFLASWDDLASLDISLSTQAEINRNVGDYDISLNSYSNSNYSIESNVATYKIDPKQITIEIVDQFSQYGNNLNMLTFSLAEGSSLEYDDQLTDLNVELVTTASSTSNATSNGYDITMAGYNNDNYTIIPISGTYYILPREILIDISNKSATYHSEHNLDNVDWQILDGYSVLEGDNLNILLNVDVTINSGVGDYQIYPITNNTNYDIRKINGIYTILPRQIDVIIQNQTIIYGNNIEFTTDMFEFTGDDMATKQDLLIELSTSATSSTGVGEYEITATCNNSNYQANITTATLTINKRELIIQLKDQDLKRFFEFNIDQNAYEIVAGSVVNNDDLNVVISSIANWYSNIGSQFELTASYDNDNYEIEFINATATMRISITDYSAIGVAVILIVLLIVLIIRRKMIKRKRQQSFTDSFNQLKNM